MNIKSKAYFILWGISIIIFNVVVFIAPIEHSQNFLIGYLFITIAFIGQLFCTYTALKNENSKKTFYTIPLITISFSGLLIMLTAGCICMALPRLPDWIGIILCFLILGFTSIAVISAQTAGNIADKIDKKTEHNISFIKNLTADAEVLTHRAKSPMIKNQCKKVYEALHYSDPVSSKELSDTERKIQEEFDILTDAVIAEDLDCTESAAKELITLIYERNKKCKKLK